MSPAILVGDHVYVDKRLYLPQRGDIVAFSFPRRPGVLLKRVIAVAGDTVEIRNDVVYLNGQPLPRRHLDGDCHYPELAAGTWTQHPCDGWQETLDGVSYETVFETHRKPFSFPATKIPEDSFFVLGDNRDNSNDSRWKGAVPDRKLIGRALFVWLSQGEGGTRWSRIGTQLP